MPSPASPIQHYEHSRSYYWTGVLLVLVAGVFFQQGIGPFFNYPAPVYAISGVMAVFVTGLPTCMIAEGIRRIGSGNASILASIGPIFTMVLASTFLHEHISFWQAIGTRLVLAGVVWIGWKG